MPKATTVAHYNPAMQALHWLVAALMFAVVPLAWVMTNMSHDAADRPLLYSLHKSIGVTIIALAAIRLVVRASSPIPGEVRNTPKWMSVASRTSHIVLYGILIGMPLTGYLQSSASGHTVWYFGLFALPDVPQIPALAQYTLALHLLGQWAVYGVVALHLMATAYHVVVRRDALLDRMLPKQRPLQVERPLAIPGE